MKYVSIELCCTEMDLNFGITSMGHSVQTKLTQHTECTTLTSNKPGCSDATANLCLATDE